MQLGTETGQFDLSTNKGVARVASAPADWSVVSDGDFSRSRVGSCSKALEQEIGSGICALVFGGGPSATADNGCSRDCDFEIS